MKYWIITAAASVAWFALWLGIWFLNRSAHNDALDSSLGNIAGIGFVSIWAVAVFRRIAEKHLQQAFSALMRLCVR
jgi:hypothetical protein